jgi:DNA-binding NtrC family response regulator
MFEPTVLLVGRTSAIVEATQTACRSVNQLQLQVYPYLDSAFGTLQTGNVGVVLAHLPTIGDEVEVTRLLRAVAATRRPCATLGLAESIAEPQVTFLLRAGFADCLELPQDLGKLAFLLDALTRRLRMSSTVVPGVGTSSLPTQEDDPDPITEVLMGQVRRVAPQETTVLLTGETGTGKTRLAKLIHDLSPRRGEPFQVVDCGALSESLAESELFGHTKGAFTNADRARPGMFASAGHGTVFLDEINSLPLTLQSKLLRAVEERCFKPVGSDKQQPLHARIIAASNAPLEQEVAEGRFRQDLYYRLNVVGFYLPPLRERRASIPGLVQFCFREFTARNRPDVTDLQPETLECLQNHHWPGNIRELRNVLERAVALCAGPILTLDNLPEQVRRSGSSPARPRPQAACRHSSPDTPATLAQTKRDVELQRILAALENNNNNRLRTARELGISRIALYKKLHKYGLMGTT